MEQENSENGNTESKYLQEELPVDDSFALLLASYRSRVYEQYYSLFTTDASEEGEKGDLAPR